MAATTRPGPGPRRRLRAPARRALVVEGGLLVFARTGYTAASMADIADASGVTRAVVYDHFASKKDLYGAVLGEQGALFLGHLETRIVSEGSPKERMRSTMDAVLAFAEDHPMAWQLLTSTRRTATPKRRRPGSRHGASVRSVSSTCSPLTSNGWG